MGIEYHLIVPPESQAAVAAALTERLPKLLQRLDPNFGTDFPCVYAEQIDEGLYICDTLTDKGVAAQVVRSAIDLMLLYSQSVTVTDA